MIKARLNLFIFFLILSQIIFSSEIETEKFIEVDKELYDKEKLAKIKELPLPEPNKENKYITKEGVRYLEKVYNVYLDMKVNVYVPLEIVSDVNIYATVLGNEILEIPFDLELNRKPEKNNYYSIKYSDMVLDIDNDGEDDTYIYSPKYINERVETNNYVKIYGEKISNEGIYKKRIYMTVEVGEE
ncbi:hypothetical protein [uncultured Fusobacterium sp.]|uniref:hypothetical protein n=1 Tax=uncultured Fusobacterium sp. TaxID=159267 RepID=UPI0025F93359|nr:hypothetical protein [uncultured Fusobacterium sp.]